MPLPKYVLPRFPETLLQGVDAYYTLNWMMGSCCGKAATSNTKGVRGRREDDKGDTTDGPAVPAASSVNASDPPSQVQAGTNEIVLPQTSKITTGGSDNTPKEEILEYTFQPHSRLFGADVHVDTTALVLMRYSQADQWSKCAYCDNPTGDRYDYFYCTAMPGKLLEDFMEHNWWRTGQVIFKPRFAEVCCPSYSMRMPAAGFLPSKSHQRIMRKWTDFLSSGDPRWEGRCTEEHRKNPSSSASNGIDEVDSPHIVIVPSTEDQSRALVQVAVSTAVSAGSAEDSKENPAPSTPPEATAQPKMKSTEPLNKQSKLISPGKGADPNRPPCRKAKVLRAERRQQRLAAQGIDSTEAVPRLKTAPQPKRPSLQELLREHKPTCIPEDQNRRHRLEVKLLPCNPRDPQITKTLPRAYQIYDKFQDIVHPGKVRFSSLLEFEWGFVNSPLKNPPDKTLGTYHMHYYLDGELMMISILDFLPTYCVSVYFFYDPDLRFLTPGIYTCLRELELLQNLQKEQPELIYYGLGYYNHFSPKVSYKKQFGPAELLCNETDTFVPIDPAIPKILLKPYVRLVDDSVPEKEGRTAPLDDLVVDSFAGPRNFKTLSQNQRKYYESPLRSFISEAGSPAAHKFLIEVL